MGTVIWSPCSYRLTADVAESISHVGGESYLFSNVAQ